MEFYEMAQFVKISTSSIEESMQWYQQKLGFLAVYAVPDAKGNKVMCHLRRKRYQDVMLVQGEAANPKGIILSLTVRNIGRVYSNFSPKEIVETLQRQPWNAFEATVRTPEGLLITLTEQADAEKDFDEVSAHIAETMSADD